MSNSCQIKKIWFWFLNLCFVYVIPHWSSIQIQKRSDWLCLITWLGRSRFTEQEYWDISAPRCKQNEPKSEYLLNQTRSGALFSLLLIRWIQPGRFHKLCTSLVVGRLKIKLKNGWKMEKRKRRENIGNQMIRIRCISKKQKREKTDKQRFQES